VNKLYLITRSDLPPGQQAVQAAHSLRQFVEEHPVADRQWFRTSNTLALLTTPNETLLGVLYRKAVDRGIPVAAFREPDRGNELTAIALGHEARRLVRNLPLALRVDDGHTSKKKPPH
jgi:hypothetical protein